MSIAAERAIDELRRGRAANVAGLAVLPVELCGEDALEAFEGDARADILITDKRAAQLALANQLGAAGMQAVGIARPDWIDAAGAAAIADPTLDLSKPMKGPFRTVTVDDTARARAALQLAKLAGLLPALHMRPARDDDNFLTVGVAEIEAHRAPATLAEVTRARLPLKAAKDTQVIAFRSPGGPEHLVLMIGKGAYGDAPLTRLHSACLTGDVLGSLKCDCGDQLRAALDAIAADGGGILLYLQQEGRGIGLLNKLRAYRLQDQGFDTVDANLRLGFEVDERDFGIAAAMLRGVGAARIRLLTNNPHKVAGLEAEGVAVDDRVPLIAGHGELNADYLATKRDRTGHQL
ncbi:GTP cyclohydrolase II [Pacificimonas sp. WHA3]|uniref:GTP cyclohydrolase-2 n=1 Tax=Pacificimonas pallii TaxID=2827236 RepID=A0ABS6SCE9_9SPHN|nr:GTP cyclohydrolase II [Pacificimonas pallii]MBV7256102.1 GTP cyclohydrolase II [Pacificimonas pallii]